MLSPGLKDNLVLGVLLSGKYAKARSSLSGEGLRVLANVANVVLCQSSFSSLQKVAKTFANSFNGHKLFFLLPSKFEYVKGFFATWKTVLHQNLNINMFKISL